MQLRTTKRENLQRIASWSGTGEVVLRPDRAERSTWTEVVLATLVCLVVDLLALAAAIIMAQRNNLTVCGGSCFDNPKAHIHDYVVSLWAFGVAAIGLIALSLITRHLRIPIAFVQLLVTVFVLAHTLPELRTSLDQQHELETCQYGYAPPCTGLQNLSPH